MDTKVRRKNFGKKRIIQLEQEAETDGKLRWKDIAGGGQLHCLDCHETIDIIGFTHGCQSNSGCQCQKCGNIFVEYESSGVREPMICPHCNTEYHRLFSRLYQDLNPVFCPKCRSYNVKYKMIYIT